MMQLGVETSIVLIAAIGTFAAANGSETPRARLRSEAITIAVARNSCVSRVAWIVWLLERIIDTINASTAPTTIRPTTSAIISSINEKPAALQGAVRYCFKDML